MRVDGYEVVEELARGAMGVVYRVRDPRRSGPDYALKLMRVPRGASEVRTKRTLREGEALARLQHPNVVKVHAAGLADGAPYLLLELVEGESLQRRLDHRGPLAPARAARLALALARALEHAHGRGVLHRDVKPDNVLVDARGEPKLADFGLMRDLAPSDSKTKLSQHGDLLGTPGYWAPEQARGEVDRLGPWTDIYGLGATLYACLTGQPPRIAETMAQFIARADAPLTPPSQLNPTVDPGLDAICAGCLEPEPFQRYADAEALAADLERYLQGETLRGIRATASWRKARRPLGWLALGAALTGIVAAAATIPVARESSRTPAPTLTPSAARAPEQRELPLRLSLDPSSVSDPAALPGLEVRAAWALRVDERLHLQGNMGCEALLELPLELIEPPFVLEGRLHLRSLRGGSTGLLQLVPTGDAAHDGQTTALALARDARGWWAVLGSGRGHGRPHPPSEGAPQLRLHPRWALDVRLEVRREEIRAEVIHDGESVLSATHEADFKPGAYLLRLGSATSVEVVGAFSHVEWEALRLRGQEGALREGDPRPGAVREVHRMARRLFGQEAPELLIDDLKAIGPQVVGKGREWTILLAVALAQAGRGDEAFHVLRLRDVDRLDATKVGGLTELERALLLSVPTLPAPALESLAHAHADWHGATQWEVALDRARRLTSALHSRWSWSQVVLYLLHAQVASGRPELDLRRLGGAWLEVGSYPRALAILRALDPADVEAMAKAGYAALAGGDPGLALRVWSAPEVEHAAQVGLRDFPSLKALAEASARPR